MRAAIRPASLLLWLCGLLLAPAAGAQRRAEIPPLYVQPVWPTVPVAALAPDTSGLRFRLTAAPTRAPERRAPAPALLLPGADASAILARLAPLQDAAPADTFAFPAATPQPPRAGRTLLAGFPPPDSLAPARPAPRGPLPLGVVRGSPRGMVDEVGEVTVAFSQPMVPLSSVGNVQERGVPVRVSPAVPGRWRWIDVRTAVFTPAGPLPGSTEYTVTIDAGTRSAAGGALAQAVSWTFRTRELSATGGWPVGTHVRREPLFIIRFDQRVNAAALVRVLRVTSGGAAIPIRLATRAEIAADSTVRALAAQAPDGTWMAFRATRPLPYAAEVEVRLPAGAPSAEGPLRTVTDQSWRFRTYGPLLLREAQCAWRGSECRPGMAWSLEFSNPLDSTAPRHVRVEPALPGMTVRVYGTRLHITGESAINTRYTVRLGPELRDVFGQTLGREETREIQVTTPEPRLIGFPERMVVVQAHGPRRLSVFARDVGRVRLRMNRARPEDFDTHTRTWNYLDPGQPLTGTPVVNRVVDIGAAPGEVREIVIDLDEVLRGEPGHVVVGVEPMDGRPHPGAYTWAQVTDIGLAAFADRDDLLVWATSLRDGSPVSGAQATLLPGGAARTDGRGLATLPLPVVPGWDNRERAPASPLPFLVVGAGADRALLASWLSGMNPANFRRPYQTDHGPWVRREAETQTLTYGVTDRNLYRPGEEVRFKGWMRRLVRSESGGLREAGGAGDSIGWTASVGGDEIATGRAALTSLGGFDGRFTLPAGATLGEAGIHLRTDDGAGDDYISFRVEEFRRPEYEVAMEADPGPHVVGTSTEVAVRASYFAGGALPGAATSWAATTQTATYTPPGWDEWRFGMMDGEWYGQWTPPPPPDTLSGQTDAEGRHAVRVSFDAAHPPRTYAMDLRATVLDVNRQPWTASTQLLVHPALVYAGLKLERAWVERGTPLEVDAIVVDLDGKPVAGRPLTVRAERVEWRQSGDRWTDSVVSSETCEVQSAVNPRRCTFRTDAGGRYRVVALAADDQRRPSRTEVTAWVSGGGPVQQPGQETVSAAVVTLVADRERYAPGDTARILAQLPFWPARGVLTIRREGLVRTDTIVATGSTVTLSIPVAERDVPNVFVQLDVVGASDTIPGSRGSDFASGTAKLSVPAAVRALTVTPVPADTVSTPDAETSVRVQVRDAAGRPVRGAEVALVVVDESVLALTGYRFTDPLELFHPEWAPGVTDTDLHPFVIATGGGRGVVRGTVRDARTRLPVPGIVVGIEQIGVRTVTDSAGAFRLVGVPRGSWSLQAARAGVAGAVMVTMRGEPVNVEVLVEQAEAILFDGITVTGYAGPPAPALAPPPPPPASPEAALQGKVAGLQMDREVSGGGVREDAAPIALRTNFAALALWAPVVRTDAEGRATVPFTLPSSFTRYRVMAVAVQGLERYGMGESALTVRQPLMVRASAPRFLNFGDRVELPIVVQNQTGEAMEVDVAARGDGIEFLEPGKRVTVPANDRVEVRIAGRAVRAGPASVQVAAVSGARSDAVVITLPVYTPATAEAFATYGNFTEGAAELPLEVPGDAIPSFGGLEVTTSSTALHELTDAYLYLASYPHQGPEQVASRLLGLTALYDVLAAFGAAGLPTPEQAADSVRRDVDALAELQDEDGGWTPWPSERASWPYLTIHVTHALQRLRMKGFAVSEQVMQPALYFIRTVEPRIPAWYPPATRTSVRAYALYVRSLAGDDVDRDFRVLMDGVRVDSLPLEAVGWLLAATEGRDALAEERAELSRVIGNRATETASTATFATGYGEGDYLLMHSGRRSDAVVLEALLRTDPRNELVAKTVRGLLGHRRQGRWGSTQENAWVLLALERYFREYEGQTPEFVSRVWLGERFAGQHGFAGRAADRHHLSVPMSALLEGRPDAVTIAKDGPGRLYYRAGLRYAPRSLRLPALDQGFAVERVYEAVDDPADVSRAADGTWRVRAGARVRVTVTMAATARRVHVALVDPLPAGFEPVNAALLGAQPPAPDNAEPGRWAWWARWYAHENLRDDRVEAFAPLLPAGVYTYTYEARATTPGEFIVPPPRAEEMYSPETFGRGGTDRVVVVGEDGDGRE